MWLKKKKKRVYFDIIIPEIFLWKTGHHIDCFNTYMPPFSSFADFN